MPKVTSAEELLRLYAEGERDFAGSELDGSDFERVDQEGDRLWFDLWYVGNLHRGEDLRGADLRGISLRDSRIQRPYFKRANLDGADFRGADLWNAHLGRTQMRGANLQGASLRESWLTNTNLSGADLRQADLRRTSITGSNFAGANLTGTDSEEATIGSTVFGDVDLSTANLYHVIHWGAAIVGVDTLQRTAVGLAQDPGRQREAEAFFRGCGVPDDQIALFRSWIGAPVQFYSVFISYSHADKDFADRLYDRLQRDGIRCWKDDHDMRIGDRIVDVVDRAVRVHDRVLLCCSEASLTSPWVEDEIDAAIERERKAKREGREEWPLLPLLLDDYLFDAESGHAARLRSRLGADFKRWKDHDAFERAYERVLVALRPG